MLFVQTVYYFIVKMLKALQRNTSSQSTKVMDVLRELEQNESLRVQLYKARLSLRDQQNHFVNSTINQQMLAENIITQLTMILRRVDQDTAKEDDEDHSLARVIEKCIEDMGNLMTYYDVIRSQCGEAELSISSDLQQIIQSYSARATCDKSLIQTTREQAQVKSKSIQKLNQDLQQVSRQLQQTFTLYKRCMQDNASVKEQMRLITLEKDRLQKDCSNYRSEVQQLRKYNDELSQQLKQSRQVSVKHVDYVKKKEREVQAENSRLIEANRQYMIQQAETARLLQQKQEQIRNLQEKLRKFETTFQEIIDRENKIKLLQEERRKRVSRIPLQQTNLNTQNHHPNPTLTTLGKEVGKVKKRFNLQSFQQKLTNATENSTVL